MKLLIRAAAGCLVVAGLLFRFTFEPKTMVASVQKAPTTVSGRGASVVIQVRNPQKTILYNYTIAYYYVDAKGNKTSAGASVTGSISADSTSNELKLDLNKYAKVGFENGVLEEGSSTAVTMDNQVINVTYKQILLNYKLEYYAVNDNVEEVYSKDLIGTASGGTIPYGETLTLSATQLDQYQPGAIYKQGFQENPAIPITTEGQTIYVIYRLNGMAPVDCWYVTLDSKEVLLHGVTSDRIGSVVPQSKHMVQIVGFLLDHVDPIVVSEDDPNILTFYYTPDPNG